MKFRLLLAAVVVLVAPISALAGTDAMHPQLAAKLLGSQEVPAGLKTAHGVVNLDVKAASGKVCWTFETAGLGKATAAHIHKGGAGTAGPVVVPLGAAFTAKGCQSASKKLLDAIETSPNGYYVNVHTAKYPNGAIRGQLVAGMMHM